MVTVVSSGIFFMMCGLCRTLTNGQPYSNISALKSILLAGYDRDIIPLLDQTKVMHVNVTVYIYNLLEADGVKGSLLMPLMTACTWMDEKLTWNPADHGGVMKVAFYQNQVWKPPLSLGTPIEFVIMENKLMHVTVMSNGMAMMNPGNIVESACSFNMEYWPFDKQVCDISFWAFDVTPDQLQLDFSQDSLKTLFTKNSEWMLEERKYFKRRNGVMNEIVYRLYLRRQAGFYILTILIPIIGLSLLGAMVFLLPHDSGERVGFSITVMLSMSVFLTIVSEQMPKTSDPLPRVCTFLAIHLISGVLESMVVIMNMRIYHKTDDEPIPGIYTALVSFVQCNCNRKRKICNISEDKKTGNNPLNESSIKSINEMILVEDMEKEQKKDFSEIPELCDKIREEENQQKEKKITWKEVSQTIDKVAWVAFFATASLSSVAFTALLMFSSDYIEP